MARLFRTYQFGDIEVECVRENPNEVFHILNVYVFAHGLKDWFEIELKERDRRKLELMCEYEASREEPLGQKFWEECF